MFSKLREVLLTQYIGSILVALLVWRAAVEVITQVVRAGYWFVNRRHGQSALEESYGTLFPWENLILSAVTIALHLLAAYALARWLYPATASTTPVDAAGETSPDQTEPS